MKIDLTETEKNIIEKELDTFVKIYGDIIIERTSYGSGYYVYTNEDRENLDYLHDFEHLKKWLDKRVGKVDTIQKAADEYLKMAKEYFNDKR